MNETIRTSRAPGAIGPYSQAVKAGNMIFVSGQLPVDPATGEIVQGTIGEMTRQCMVNVTAILWDAGFTLEHVVKTTIFLKDMGDFGEVNGVYGEYFPFNPPARACVEVARLPKDAPIEIECIAVKS